MAGMFDSRIEFLARQQRGLVWSRLGTGCMAIVSGTLLVALGNPYGWIPLGLGMFIGVSLTSPSPKEDGDEV